MLKSVIRLSLVVVVILAPALGSPQDCKPQRRPDGSWSADCGSNAPPTPAPNLPPLPQASPTTVLCATQIGSCWVLFNGTPAAGSSCYCSWSNGAQASGITR